MTMLVTGGAGFIGSNFIRHMLAEHPETPIVNLDALTYAGNPESLRDVADNPNYTFVRGDICDAGVFAIIRALKPSGRGELEITDVNNAYIRRDAMKFAALKGFWSDAGTFESLLRASVMVRYHDAGAEPTVKFYLELEVRQSTNIDGDKAI